MCLPPRQLGAAIVFHGRWVPKAGAYSDRSKGPVSGYKEIRDPNSAGEDRFWGRFVRRDERRSQGCRDWWLFGRREGPAITGQQRDSKLEYPERTLHTQGEHANSMQKDLSQVLNQGPSFCRCLACGSLLHSGSWESWGVFPPPPQPLLHSSTPSPVHAQGELLCKTECHWR
ncbi:hypothetical protein CRENBAI_008044 [Crenichthys baileyi]|uniref:Uncharacterized protein n=1 Tax=Crenichthys baileyi TaxID=28760 RepID=A0AAV9QMQ7_9TELE